MKCSAQLSSHLLAATLAIVPAVAGAQASTGELRDAPYAHRIAGELGFYNYREDLGGLLPEPMEAVVAAPSIYGTFGLLPARDEGVVVDLDFAWRLGAVAGDWSAFRAGNPYLGVRAGYRTESLRVRGGLGFTAPLTNAYDDYRWSAFDAHGLVALALPLGMHGEWDAWLSAPLSASVIARADFEYRSEYFLVGAEAGFGAIMPVEYHGRTGDTSYAAQVGAYAAGRPIRQLAIGLRGQTVMMDSSVRDTSPFGYGSLIPFIRGEFGRKAFVESRFVINVDDNIGFGSDGAEVWAVYVSAGGTFGGPEPSDVQE